MINSYAITATRTRRYFHESDLSRSERFRLRLRGDDILFMRLYLSTEQGTETKGSLPTWSLATHGRRSSLVEDQRSAWEWGSSPIYFTRPLNREIDTHSEGNVFLRDSATEQNPASEIRCSVLQRSRYDLDLNLRSAYAIPRCRR